MKQLYIKIADHIIKVESKSDKVLNWIAANFHIIDLYLVDSIHLNIDIEDHYGSSFIDFNVDRTEKNNRIFYNRKDYSIEVDNDIRQAIVKVHDDYALKHALITLYSAFIVHHNWGLLIHSSCMEEDHKAYLFSGHSGAGKSTVAKLSAPRPILSDEATVAKIDKQNVLVYDSPFRSDTVSQFNLGPLSLQGIFLLHQSKENHVSRVSNADVMASLMDKIFYWSYNPKETLKIFTLCKLLIQNVPVYDLHFQKNNLFWELISNEQYIHN